jgi:hypothetical protein
VTWYADWKKAEKHLPSSSEPRAPRTMGPSEEIVWLREHVLKKGPKDNPPYADAAKRLAELYAQNYPGVEEDPAT